jgi:hypothetical protein
MSCCFSDKKKQKNFHKIHPLPKSPQEKPISILKNKRVKRKSIYPQQNNIRSSISENKRIIEEKSKQRDAFTKKFLAEIIHCGACQEKFSLGDHALQINCGSCNKFFHCSIAGACVGPNCSVVLDGKKESLKYCMGCVNPYLKINIMDNGQSLCKTCEIDPRTDKKLLKV